LRLATAVIVLPWHNPVLLAEQAAILDLPPGAGSISASASARAIDTTSSPGFCELIEHLIELSLNR
jgi:hypothetical protein